MDNKLNDEELWKLAAKRARFQRHLATYFIMNAFFWAIWWFTDGRYDRNEGMPWPVWAMLGWGIGLAFQYMEAYGGGKTDMVNKEFERLKKQRDQNP